MGKELCDIVIKNKFKGCVDEIAMFIYSNCTLEEYVEKYLPKFVRGVSNDVNGTDYTISKVQRKLNNYIDTKIDMDIYLKHL